MAKNGYKAMDSDLHVYEPHDLYLRYMDPKWGDRIPRAEPRKEHGRLVFRYADGTVVRPIELPGSRPVERPITREYKKPADFYRRGFDLKEVRRTPSGGVLLSDGHISFAILKLRESLTPKGLHHFGFLVDDVEKTEQRLREIRPNLKLSPLQGAPFADYQFEDPDGNPFDVSDKDWPV